MTLTQNNIVIELESEEEIMRFWNIIAFAVEYHNERKKSNIPCMTKDELNMAMKLKSLTEKKW